MSTLFLHIGSHKTGTTSIQAACMSAMPRTGQGGAQYIDIRHSGTNLMRYSGRLENFHARIELEIAEKVFRPQEDKTAAPRAIASDEDLFWISDSAQIQEFAAMLKQRYEAITIICYLRRQDLLALSHRKQVTERGPAVRFYGLTITPLPKFLPHFHSYFDYASKLKLWGDAFGKQNIQVLPYEPSTLLNGDVVQDFAERVGVRFTLSDQLRRNSSLAGNRTLVGLKLAQQKVPPKLRKAILNKLPPAGKFLPSQDEARAFLANFAEPNVRLAREWSWRGEPLHFMDSFDMYPETLGPQWSNDEVNRMLNAVLSINEGLRNPGNSA